MKNNQNLNKSSNYEEDLPKEAFEIVPSEGDEAVSEEDKKLQKPSNHLTDSYNNNYSNMNFESNLKEAYERRSREQSKVISDLHEYKLLCEKRIKQLYPGHPLPIKEAHLNFPPSEDKVSGNLENENHNLKKEIQNLRNIINFKEEELSQLNKKLENLSAKLNHVYTESVPKTQAIKKDTATGKKHSDFPPADRIPIDKIKENYQRLQQTLNSLLAEKEQILESFRLETVTNEAQRNYIEILKQALENKINNNGMKNYIQQQKQNYYGREVSNIDVLVDFTQFKSETESAKKELVMANVYINELKQEIEFLKKVNEDLSIKHEKMKENFENNRREIISLTDKFKELEIDKNNIEETRAILKDENERLVKDYDQIILKNRKCEKENSDLSKRINELNLKLLDMNVIQGRLNEFKRNFDKLNEDYSILANEKTKIEEDLNKTCGDLTAKSEEAKITKVSLKEKLEKLDNEKKSLELENSNLNSKIKKLEKQTSDLQITIKDSQDDCKIFEDRNRSLETQLNLLKIDFENLSKDHEEFKTHNQKEIEKLENTIKENHLNNKELKHQLDTMILERKTLSDDHTRLKKELSTLEKENSVQRNNLEMTEKNLGNLNDQYEEIIFNYRQLEKDKNNLLGEKESLSIELRKLKEKAENDTRIKNQEIMNLELELNNYKEKVINLTQKSDSQQGEINNYKNIIKENNFKIDDFLNKEIVYKKKEEHLAILNNKFETLYFEHNTLVKLSLIKIKEFNNLTEKLEETLKEKNYISDSLKNKEKTLNNLVDENTKLRHNINQITQSNDDIYSKYEKLASENNQFSLKNNELLNKSNLQIKHLEELNLKLHELNFEKEHNEALYKKILSENENLRHIENELNFKLNSLQNTLSEANSCAKSSLTLLKNNFTNFIIGRFSKSINELLLNLNINLDFDINLKDYFRVADEFYKMISNELEMYYHEKNELSEKNKINLNISQVLEQKIVSLDKEKSNIEHNLRFQVKQFAEDNKALILDNESLNRKYEKLFQELKKLKSDYYQIGEDKREFLEENKHLNETINSILKEKEDLENTLTETKNTIKALEERMVITIHERNIFESLLSRVSNAYPHREMSRSINECLDILYQNFEIEREKLKLEQRINLLGNELLHNEKSSNIDLKTKLNQEIENLKNVYCQYNDKLEENLNKQKMLEDSMKMFEVQEKRKNEKIIEYEQLITKLKKEYNEAIDELRKYKPVNLFKNNLSHESRNPYISTSSSIGKSLTKFNTNKEIFNDNIKTEVLLKTESNYNSNKPESTKQNTNNTYLNYKPKINPRYDTLNTTNNEEKINRTNCTLPAYDNMSVDNSYIASDKKPLNETDIQDIHNMKLTSVRNNYSGIMRNNNKLTMDLLNNNNFTHKDI